MIDETLVSLNEEAGRKTMLKGTFLGATVYPGPGFYWHRSVGIEASGQPVFIPQDKRERGVLYQSLPDGLFFVNWANGIKSQHKRLNEGKGVFSLISPGILGFYDPAEFSVFEIPQQGPSTVFKTGDYVRFKFGFPNRELHIGGRVNNSLLLILFLNKNILCNICLV